MSVAKDTARFLGHPGVADLLALSVARATVAPETVPAIIGTLFVGISVAAYTMMVQLTEEPYSPPARNRLKALGILAGAAVAASSCAPRYGEAVPSEKMADPETAAALLAKQGIDPGSAALIRAGVGRYAVLVAEGARAEAEFPWLVEVASAGGGQIYDLGPEMWAGLPDGEKEQFEGAIEEEFGVRTSSGVGLVFAGVLASTLAKSEVTRRLLDHLQGRRDEEIAACREGRMDGVGHRRILMLVIVGSAAAALAAGERGIDGVKLEAVRSTAGVVEGLISVPPAALQGFLSGVGKTMEDLYLNGENLVQDFAGSYVVRFVFNKLGTGTFHFLTRDYQDQSFAQYVNQYREWSVTYGRQVDGKVAERFREVLAAFAALYHSARQQLKKDFRAMCRLIGSTDPATPSPTPTLDNFEKEAPAFADVFGVMVGPDGETTDLLERPGYVGPDGGYLVVPVWSGENVLIEMP